MRKGEYYKPSWRDQYSQIRCSVQVQVTVLIFLPLTPRPQEAHSRSSGSFRWWQHWRQVERKRRRWWGRWGRGWGWGQQ